MPTSDEAYKAIGLVVINCQFLEVAFVVCVKLAFAQQNVNELSEIEPLNKNAFKVPAKALLNELRNHIEISPEFEAKFTDVVERRHELIHRWLLQNKWPEDHDASGLGKVIEFANGLIKDVNALTRLLVSAIYTWLQKFPEAFDSLKPLSDNWLMVLPEEYRMLGIKKA